MGKTYKDQKKWDKKNRGDRDDRDGPRHRRKIRPHELEKELQEVDKYEIEYDLDEES
jgi:hypothetical protein